MEFNKLIQKAAQGAQLYVCGPDGLIEAARQAAARAGWSEERVHFERFRTPSPGSSEKPFTLVLARSGQKVIVGPDESALAALERLGVPVASSCQAGSCGTCAVRVLSGNPDHRDVFLSDIERSAGSFTTCVSRAHSEALVIDL